MKNDRCFLSSYAKLHTTTITTVLLTSSLPPGGRARAIIVASYTYQSTTGQYSRADVFCPHMPSYIRRLLPRCYLRVVYHQVVELELIVASSSYTYQSTTGQYRPAQPAQDRGTLDTRDFPCQDRGAE